MGKAACIQGPKSPTPQRDILVFGNNVYFKLRIVPRVFLVASSDHFLKDEVTEFRQDQHD